ncbi:MAG: hypothetical protein IH921_09015 [Gemmatimonadetes bacterium]|nr:hypothetical protein [Gemmatimonadota bacterium]
MRVVWLVLHGEAQVNAPITPLLQEMPGGVTLGQHSVRPNFSPARTYATVAKCSEVIMSAGEVGAVMRRAFHALRNGRPGPVIVEIPADVGGHDVPEAALSYQPPKRSPQSPSAGDIKEAVKLLLSAKKPVIWSGAGVLFAGATEELKELAELTEIPVYCTLPGKSSFDERHPLALGAGSSATTLQARRWLQESDVLFATGSSLSRTSYGQPIPDGKVMIHNVESIEDINKDYTVDVGLPGDTKLALQAMIDEVKSQLGEKGRKGQTNVAAEIAEIRKQWMSEWNVFAKIPVIVFTASEDPEHLRRAYALGVRRYMRKPENYGALVEAVKEELRAPAGMRVREAGA